MKSPHIQSPSLPAAEAAPANWRKRLKARQILNDESAAGAAAEPMDLSPLPPDYRFRTAAAAAVEGRMLSRRRHDRWTCELADYFAAQSECSDDGERSAIDRRYGDVALAVRARSGTDREMGFLVEAYTLARLWRSDFYMRLRMSSAAVQRYQRYFCDYGALLDNPAYVIRHARIEQSLTSNDAMLQRKGVLLLVGYFCGRPALDLLIWSRSTRKGSHVWSNLPDTLEHIQLFELLRRAVLPAFTCSNPPRTPSDYATLADQLNPLIHRHGLGNTPTQNMPSLPPMSGHDPQSP